ncbi:hypothetical protein Dgeo_2949 (plasmid) [Deinococcus geothermalis DSM 11300]|uniref:Conjugal transfer protein n=1 Tax=Deinococcus geothermalis (strain DSM 11300 / CIP 105573 / AG-3a) TaxID=319795 RepID=A8ZR83_DEIGD|nr:MULTISPECIES: hypothetical protein [Deinococcus]ABW34992.1 hypothetical protein Dgeo_2949 [Deinococcus geothermalis DSM 11300]TDE84982.1 hypothetical protein E0686_14160 [Deinococcus sp. S9]
MKRILLTTLALGIPASTSPALAINPGNLGQVGEVWQFVQQLQQWTKSLTDLQALKDSLFGDVNYQDIGQQLLGRALDAGLKYGGIDVKSYLGKLTEFQGRINELRGKLLAQAKGIVSLAFLDPKEDAFGMRGSLALNPNMAQNRFLAAKTIAQTTKDTSENTQMIADGVKLVEETKQTVQQTKDRADQAAKNASALTQAATTIQSTREGVQLLVRAQAEAIMSSTYNATALTTAISQQVRQQQVTNEQLSELVNGMLADRASAAKQALEEVRARQAQASAAGKQVQTVIDTAASGISTAFDVTDGAINVDSMF